ncbi:MAG: nucleotide exchange factor GrpE [Bacteroidales bacterium]
MKKQEDKMKDKEKDTQKQKEQEQKEQEQEQKQEDAQQQQKEENSKKKKEEKKKVKQEKEASSQKEKKQEDKQEEQKDAEKEKSEQKEKTDKEKLNELQDKYLRLTAEYDNYRRRTLKEKMELSRNAGEDILQSMLPVMDDFDRALQSIDEAEDIEAVKEGIHLIYNKFKELLEQKGVKEIGAKDEEFNTDKHEAVSKIPAPSEDMKGKVVDVVQKGYYLNNKVLRFSKVVVGE